MSTAFALPEGRSYEMVSPLYKGGYAANTIEAAAADGESLAFASIGAFAETPSSPAQNGYLARRGSGGWQTVPLVPPADIAPYSIGNPIDFSPSLDLSLSSSKPGPNGGVAEFSDEDELLLHDTRLPDNIESTETIKFASIDGKRLSIGIYSGASKDLSHLFLDADNEEQLLPEASAFSRSLYEVSDNDSSLKLVNVNSSGEPIDPYCPAVIGTEVGKGSKFNAVTANGAEVLFTTNPLQITEGKGECDGQAGAVFPKNPATLYVRLAAHRTVTVAEPLPSECSGVSPCVSGKPSRVEFVGANESGSKVFFTTSRPLINEDVDAQNDLYMAELGCPAGQGGCDVGEWVVRTLRLISHDPQVGQAAAVQDALLVSADGSHVYFVARGQLNDTPNQEGNAPIEGADNLYVDDTTSSSPPAFVADLCSGPETSGEARDSQCPTEGEADSGLWTKSTFVQLADEGRFLAFSTVARLSSDDADSRRDLYRYDAETGRLERVSIGENGYDANGNNSGFEALFPHEGAPSPTTEDLVYGQAGLGTRSISEDGTRIIFMTDESLSPHAINGLLNVYEWHKEPGWPSGKVALVSTGNSTSPVNDAVMSSSGRDVFFVTAQGLLSQDRDSVEDVYDARIGGGFPVVATEPQPCSGDGCQGPLTNPAPLLVPGSVEQAPGGNFFVKSTKVTVKKKQKVTAKHTKRRKRASRSKRRRPRKLGGGK